MALPIGPTVGVLADNLRFRGSVLPVPAGAVTRWAGGLGLPAGGETVLYTGSMYQLIPYIAAMGRAQERLAESWMARFAGLGRAANRILNVSAFMARPASAARAQHERTLANIARLLGDAGIEFGYLYEAELYSGALAYDLGLDEVLQAHARKVYDTLKSRGVRRLITVDPHTTNMLRSVYPKLIPGYDLEVESYLEVLAKADRGSVTAGGPEVVVHDSCVYARYEKVIEEPRRLLRAAGFRVAEPDFAGKLTWCCGGPVESLYPRKALEGASKRLGQLAAVSHRIVTMCPICLVNLRRVAPAGVQVNDISDYLANAAGRGE